MNKLKTEEQKNGHIDGITEEQKAVAKQIIAWKFVISIRFVKKLSCKVFLLFREGKYRKMAK